MSKIHRNASSLLGVLSIGGFVLLTGILHGRAGTVVEATASTTDAMATTRPQDAAPDRGSAPSAPKPVPAADPDDPSLAGHFSGRVIGPDDRPLPRARIFIAPDRENLRNPGAPRSETDVDGRFSFDAPDMTYPELDGLPARRPGLIIATADGYAPDWMYTWGQTRGSFRSHWDPVKGADVTLRLVRPGPPIHGRFLDPSGRPLAGARVRLSGLMIPWKHDLDMHLASEVRYDQLAMSNYERQLFRPGVLPGLATETRTDADGRFRLTGLGRDRLATIEVTAPGVIDHTLMVMTRDVPDVGTRRGDTGRPTQMIHGAGFTLKLEAGRRITGVVRDRDTRRPIPDMWVGIRGSALDGLTTGSYPWATDAQGRFTITGVHPASIGQEVMAVPRPGCLYIPTSARTDENGFATIECPRGVPFRLKLTDEEGRRVEADVTYQDINPNPRASALRSYDARWPIDRAARRPIGSYEGFVLPGPGAVLVKTPGRPDYRPAHVDPKAFFAPGKTDWSPLEKVTSYGTDDVLNVHAGWWADQSDYAAIILVNPPADSQPLELSATIEKDKPRQLAIVDPAGRPVVGVQTDGLTFHPYDTEPRLRTSSFVLSNLRPGRLRRINLVQPERQLVGFLLARGGEEVPTTIRMQPWATVTGRLLDEDGQFPSAAGASGQQAMPATLTLGEYGLVVSDDPGLGQHRAVQSEASGRFRIEGLMPGQRYSASVSRGIGRDAGMAFENLVLRPGETRDLGDIRTRPPVDPRGR